MNEQQPYEKHLADKLQRLKPPDDANSNWPQMKALLDREMPIGGGGGNKNRWWIYSLIGILLLIGTWFGTSLISKDKKESTNVAATPSTSSSEENKDLSADGNTDAQKTNDESTGNKSAVTTSKNNNKESKPDDVSEENNTDNKSSLTAVTNNPEAEEENTKLTSSRNTDKGSSKTKGGTTAKNSISGDGTAAKADVVTNKKNTGNKNSRNNPARQVVYVPVASGKNKQGITNSGNTRTNSIESGNQKTTSNSVEENAANASVVRQDISSPEMAAIDYPDSLQTDYAVQSQLVTAKTRSRFKANTDRVKGLKNRTVGAGDDKNFVLGLSLPMAFPLGEQTPIAYNHNAGPNTVTDYLPAPHMQYHFNRQSYFQAELQVLSPQYIHPALLYEKSYVQTGTTNYRYVTNSVYAKKLYYFSLPVGVHYSPFKNFYLGSGVQFSSLLSGVAQYESRGSNSVGPAAGDTLFSSSIQKFKNDSISSQLSNNEFRLMLDANYYWHRFTVGFRYNQALSNFVSVQVNSFSPLYTDKNKSIQFYLRYNIWEDMKKKKKVGSVAGR